jgi:hypothetical protein
MYNNSYIKMGQYKRIAHMILYGSMINEIAHRTDYVAKLRKATEINLTNSCRHYVFVGDTFKRSKHLLRTAYDMNFEIAVFWFEGTWPLNNQFEEELLDVIDEEWSKTRWLAAGHILYKNKGEDAPKFHTQCVVINLKEWIAIGEPSLFPDWDGDYPNFIASEENFHDDYTPFWLKPVDGKIPEDDIVDSNGTLNITIPIALNNGLMIHNIPYSVRAHKYCCYPEDDIEQTESWLLDTNWSDQDVDTVSRYSHYEVQEDKQELYGLKIMKSHVMYITNTEAIPGFEKYNCNVMTAPCSGLHQFKHMTNAIDTLERVIWTDFSQAGIWWTKTLLNEWDGKDFHAFFKSKERILREKFVAYHACNYDRELAESFVNHYESMEVWLDHWDRIRKLDHTFMEIDLVKNWEHVVDEIGKDNNVFLQVSNIWQYETNYLNTPHHQAQAAFINLINELLKNNREVYITGDSPGGVYYNYQNMKEVISII